MRKTGQTCIRKQVKSARKEVRNDLQPLLNKYKYKHAGAREDYNPVTHHSQSVEDQCEPYNPEWALVVFDGLSKGPGDLPRPATAFLRKLIEVDRSPLQILDHQAKHGWPEINRMFEWPKALDLASVPLEVRPMASEMEPVRSGTALWFEWRAEFEARGWPFPAKRRLCRFHAVGREPCRDFLLRCKPGDGVIPTRLSRSCRERRTGEGRVKMFRHSFLDRRPHTQKVGAIFSANKNFSGTFWEAVSHG
ncbi:hypothetical protein HED49_10185 [Ochrobactrum daejeonense]|nr:hypothetical protein [Brucella daejeonensis]